MCFRACRSSELHGGSRTLSDRRLPRTQNLRHGGRSPRLPRGFSPGGRGEPENRKQPPREGSRGTELDAGGFCTQVLWRVSILGDGGVSMGGPRGGCKVVGCHRAWEVAEEVGLEPCLSGCGAHGLPHHTTLPLGQDRIHVSCPVSDPISGDPMVWPATNRGLSEEESGRPRSPRVTMRRGLPAMSSGFTLFGFGVPALSHFCCPTWSHSDLSVSSSRPDPTTPRYVHGAVLGGEEETNANVSGRDVGHHTEQQIAADGDGSRGELASSRERRRPAA